MDSEIGRIYAEIVVSLRKQGRPVPSNDIWIAALATRAGAPLLTYDSHFSAIERVRTVILSTS